MQLVLYKYKFLFYFQVDYFVKLMKIDEQTDEYTAVGRLLPKLVSNSLAHMINYAGSGVKLKFEDTKLHEAINCKSKFVFVNLVIQTIFIVFRADIMELFRINSDRNHSVILYIFSCIF